MSAVSMRTTTVKYQTKPQAAVQYKIALLSGALVYNPNKSEQIEGKLEWRVYKIEGGQRLPMSNSQEGMACRCGYSDSPINQPDIDTSDNVTFEDGGAAQVAYNSESTKQFTIIYGSVTGSVFTQLARLDVPVNVIGKDAAVVASIDFDNNNASILYNSIKGEYVEQSYPVSNISVVEDGVDISKKATIYVEVHGLSARIKGRGYDIPLSGGSSAVLTTVNGTGIISVTVNSVESTGYVLASYTDSAGVAHTTKFNVSRSVGRYAVEIITTPTQISYNQTTGIASSSTITATLNVIDIYGNRSTGVTFSDFGAMQWRYVGENWPDPDPDGQSVTKLEITNPNFTKSGVEFRFIDGSGNQLDYETVPFSSVTNGGDAYLVNVASMNVAVVLTSISYGTPTGNVTNRVYLTKNNEVLSSGVEYKIPGENGNEYTLSANGTKPNISYNGWVFSYMYLNGQLASALIRVDENSPTSVHIPIVVVYPTDNITRTVLISYSAIQKGPAGRSYKPNTPELYDPTKEYVWNDKQRDFIYYAFKVNSEGEQDDEKGVLSYFQYGVKEYNKNGSVTKPPSAKGGDTNWELVSEYKSIIVNCLFGTNAVLGGLKFTSETMESSTTYDDGTPNIKIDGKNGEVIFNKAILRGEVYAKSGSFTGEVNANSGTFSNCTINETCKAGFMKYAANQHNNYVINCGLVNLIDIQTDKVNPTFYLPSVSSGEFMKIIVMNVVSTKITIPDFTLSIYGGGVFNDFYNFPPGDKRYTRPITILRGDYYEFLGMNDGNGTMWICTNKPLPRI